MSVKIRLTRKGTRSKPYYRIVAADTDFPRDGRFLEILGTYDPKKNPAEVTVKAERIRKWLNKGAKATLTVANLLKTKGIEAKVK
ncbi:MAG: 30S ribosomal protein S16 [Syntrophaceae bacterium]|nr:30S ribosomal protein S16 [Syntrophaceae bacterium]